MKLRSKRGFTLIELLVVVVIIAVLAAVAVPQYNKAIEKSRAADTISLLKTLVNAEESFYLIHGAYTNKIEELDVSIPWQGTERWATNWLSSHSNEQWAFHTNVQTDGHYSTTADAVAIGRLTGTYQGGGFVYILTHSHAYIPGLYCAERYASGKTFQGDSGSYCEKMFNATYAFSILSSRLYRM